MIWQKYSKRLIEVLGLSGRPIAVSYTIEPSRGKAAPKYWVCEAMNVVREGKEIVLTAGNCVCGSGAWQIGLIPAPTGEEYRSLARFLVDGEKLCKSYAAVYRMNRLITRPPYGLGDTIYLSPMDKARQAPDIVVFIVNAEQASRIVALATFNTGIPPKMETLGPTCHQVIGYPMVSGEINMSVMDITTRKHYKPDEMFVTIPGYMLGPVMEAVDRSTAGVAPFEIPKDMAQSAFYAGGETISGKTQKIQIKKKKK